MQPRRWILSSLSLAGLFGCNVEATTPAAAPRPRIYEEPLPLEYDCVHSTHVTLQHTDGTVDEDFAIAEGLVKYARPGDLVEVKLARTPACVAERGPQVSLAAYTTPGIVLAVLKDPPSSLAYDMDTARIDDKGGTLVVRLPDCFFRLELVHGDALRELGGASPGHADADRIVSVQGGDETCEKVPRLKLATFDTVERGWGDAPLLTHFGWAGEADVVDKLACGFDLDGDGALEQFIEPCKPSTASFELKELPSHTYSAPGEHRPRMMISDGDRRLWASTSVLANNLQLKPDVSFPDDDPDFIEADVAAGKPDEVSAVKLRYTPGKPFPIRKVGEIVVGKGAAPYMLRVTEVVPGWDSVVYIGKPARLDEVIAGGFFGVRDYQLPTEGATCVGTCVGEFVPVDLPPGQAAAPPQLALGGMAIDELADSEDETEHKYGIKLTVPLGKGDTGGGGDDGGGDDGGGDDGGIEESTESEAELFAGIVVKKFVIDNLVFGDLKVDIEAEPLIEVSVALVKEFSDSMSLGDWTLAALPTPIPIIINMMPYLEFSAAFKFTGKFEAKAPFSLKHGENGWEHTFDPEEKGDVEILEGGPKTEYALESKFTLIDALGFKLGFLQGPHIAPSASLGVKATFEPDECKFCMAVFGEIGGEIGWHGGWLADDIIDPVEFGIAEIEFGKRCDNLEGDVCEDPDPPPPPPPPGGGSQGDVHVISHDGLMFDFQAGGEFVLVRATAGTPLEIQARQEPIGDNLSLSYNTAIATKVGSSRVGFYTSLPAAVYVNGESKTLTKGLPVDIGGGKLVLGENGRYTLTYPGGEILRVDHRVNHLNVAVNLPASRAGAIEGVLGDGDGNPADDIAIVGGFLPQPVSFDALYRGAGSFTEAWRVPDGGSLFDYAPGTTAQTFRGEPYKSMPLAPPPPDPPFAETAESACDTCPPALRDGCLLDVGFTGDPSFAAACAEPVGDVSKVMYPSNGLVCVSPRYFAGIDGHIAELVFRGPGLAGADQFPPSVQLGVYLNGMFNHGFTEYPAFAFTNVFEPPGDNFDCVPIGEGWGQCTLQVNLDTDLNPNYGFPKFRWDIHTWDGLQSDSAYFTRN